MYKKQVIKLFISHDNCKEGEISKKFIEDILCKHD